VHPDVAACGMLHKAGMRREGEGVQNRLLNGEWFNTSWYAILASEFQPRGAGS
jgi:RimJ/RimL family protein N-acetyltransferase